MDCLNAETGLFQRFRRVRFNYSLNQTRMPELNQNLTVGRNFSDVFALSNDNYTFSFRNDTVISRIRPGDIIPLVISVDFLNETMNVTANDSIGLEIRII